MVVAGVVAAGGTAAALEAGSSHGGGRPAAEGRVKAGSGSASNDAGGATSSHPMVPAPAVTGSPVTAVSVPPNDTTPPSTGATTEVAADCDGPGSTADVVTQEPASIIIACADDGLSLVNLRWSSWSDTSASGAGTLRDNLCTPDCAAGTIATYPASVTLSGVVETQSGPVFTEASLSYPDGGPTNVAGQAMTQFTLWYPGL